MTIRHAALLGFGNVAAHGHAPAWRARGDVRIVAVADIDPQRRRLAAETFPAARIYADPLPLLANEAPDLVDIATPPAEHAPLIARAAAAGRHILCEKPLVTTLDDLRQAVRAAGAAGVTLYTVHNWKHSPHFRRVASLIRDGAVGRLQRIRLETIRNGQSVTVGSPWRTDAEQAGGGILFDHGWHAFYLLLGLAGERPTGVSATVERRRPGSGNVEDSVHCVVDFSTITGEIDLTWAGSERRTRWRIEGDRGAIELDEARLVVERGGRTEQTTLPESLSAGSHHADWFGAIIDGFLAEVDDHTRRGQNLAEADACLTLISLAYASAARGRPLKVSPQESNATAP